MRTLKELVRSSDKYKKIWQPTKPTGKEYKAQKPQFSQVLTSIKSYKRTTKNSWLNTNKNWTTWKQQSKADADAQTRV